MHIHSLFKKNCFLSDIWKITSTYFDFENYILNGKSKYYKLPYEYDITKDIFVYLKENLKLFFNVLSLKTINKKYKKLNDPQIIQNIYINNNGSINEKLKLCHLLLIRVNFLINKKYYYIYDLFLDYIEKINVELKKQGFFFSLEANQIISINSDFETKNITSLFPLLKDYGQTGEFLTNAFNEYIHGNYDSSVINAGKATETVLKFICERNGYIKSTDKITFSKLFETLNINNFFKREEYTSPTLINNLIEGLKTGLPGHRNYSAHGSSLVGKSSNKYVAKLNLDLMVSYIHYFISIDKNL